MFIAKSVPFYYKSFSSNREGAPFVVTVLLFIEKVSNTDSVPFCHDNAPFYRALNVSELFTSHWKQLKKIYYLNN